MNQLSNTLPIKHYNISSMGELLIQIGINFIASQDSVSTLQYNIHTMATQRWRVHVDGKKQFSNYCALSIYQLKQSFITN